MKGVYAIVEFATAEDAGSVVRNASLPPLSGRRLIVKERSLRKEIHLHHVGTEHTKERFPLTQHKQQSANEQMAAFLSEELIINLKSSSTVC